MEFELENHSLTSGKSSVTKRLHRGPDQDFQLKTDYRHITIKQVDGSSLDVKIPAGTRDGL
jgi:hypothetical protein